MKLTYAISVYNELSEIQRLLPHLINNKENNDEIIILYDEKNGSEEVLNYLLKFNILPNVQTWRGLNFNNNFANWKNKLNEYCTGDYIFQLDADEMISEFLIKNIKQIISHNSEIDLFYFGRINIVNGLTDEYVKKWRWRYENGRVNFPDFQGRLYKSYLKWDGKVHEKIIGAKHYSLMPTEDEYCIYHEKSIERQIKQNNYYEKI
jgi:glycosyltransferase involved in cell wall biosynthesis